MRGAVRMTQSQGRPQKRWRLWLALIVLSAATCEGSCDVSGPLGVGWGPGPSGPTFPPGSFFFFMSDERAVELGDTLVIRVSDASGARWTVSDTTVASISGDEFSAILRPRRLGLVSIAVQAHGRTLTRMMEVVGALCQRAAVTTPIAVGTDTSFDLGADDCRLGYHPGFYEWPQDSLGPTFPSLSAEGRRLLLTDTTLVRFDAVSSAVHPLVAIMDSTDWSLAMRRNPWGRAFIARRLPPGSYTVWIAGEPNRPTSAMHLAARAVPLCSDSTAAIGLMAIGVAVEGSLEATDCHSAEGWAQDWWRITLPTGGWYRVLMQPTSTTNYQSPVVFQRGGYVSELPVFWEAGTYTLEASALSDLSYRLRVIACTSATVCP